MKKALRINITGPFQPFFLKRYIKDNADREGVKGFIRILEDGRAEIFIEGDQEKVENMAIICRRGPSGANFRKVEEKTENFQDFKEFKMLNI